MAGQANGPPGPESAVTPTRAETLAALSLAIDLGLGQPMEHMLRACVLAIRLADEVQLSEDRRATVYYATLLAWIGCHADSYELAAVFGDDIAFRASVYTVDNRGMPLAALMLRQVGAGQPPLRRAAKAAGFLVGGARTMHEVIRSHCTSAGLLATQMGLGERLAPTLACLFERWDGAGLPNGVARRGDPAGDAHRPAGRHRRGVSAGGRRRRRRRHGAAATRNPVRPRPGGPVLRPGR